MKNNCAFILIDKEGQITSERFSHSIVETQQTELSRRRLKDAVSQLWDYQTRAEMDGPELDRYAIAKRLVRKQRFASAKVVLSSPEPKHAESFNLLGLIHESFGNFDDARKCYGRASTLDKECWAPQMNARRIYELHTFGRSRIPMYL